MFKIPEEVRNKYEFVTLAAKRAEQLQAGALPRVDSSSGKVTVVAQEEVAAGLIAIVDPAAPPAETASQAEEE